MIDTRTTCITLYDYRPTDLDDFIKGLKAGTEVIQILPTSPMTMNEKTGIYHRDYLAVYKTDDRII